MEQMIGDTAWIEAVIQDFIKKSPVNTLQNQANEKAFENPLVGFSRGDDPIFNAFKDHVGPFHWTPLEIFTLTFPDSRVKAEDLSVISWILPQTQATRAENRKEIFYPSERWARARIYGEEVNAKLRRLVVHNLMEKGYEALAPGISSHFQRQVSEKYGLASTWSERHAAYASGLGTFGLSDGLITPRGKAMRTGSVVARISLTPTPRSYTDHHAYCLFFSKGTCGKCISRCPAGALSEAGHDKEKCRNHVRSAAEHVKRSYGFEGYGCGLCQTGVPCESQIPKCFDS